MLVTGLLAGRFEGPETELVLVAPLCFTMGLQNALITKIRDFPVRTTHVTGMVTDIAVELGRILYLSLIHISEPTRRTPISYAVFCLKKKSMPSSA